jgi:uncharacterized Zn-finger protein
MKNFQCTECSNKFSTNTIFSCDLCDFSSNLKSDLEKHSKAVHVEKKYFKCDICDQAFSRKDNLTKYVVIVHEIVICVTTLHTLELI